MGKMVEVEIYETGKHFMKAKLVDNSEIINPGLKSPLMKGEVSGVLDKVCCDDVFILIILQTLEYFNQPFSPKQRHLAS